MKNQKHGRKKCKNKLRMIEKGLNDNKKIQ